jgi:hypothetical protein
VHAQADDGLLPVHLAAAAESRSVPWSWRKAARGGRRESLSLVIVFTQ